jgi:hypothetical protein
MNSQDLIKEALLTGGYVRIPPTGLRSAGELTGFVNEHFSGRTARLIKHVLRNGGSLTIHPSNSPDI